MTLGSTGCQPVVRGSLPQTGLFLQQRWLHRLRKLHLAGSQMLQASSLCSPERNLHRYGRFYRWVRVVANESEIFEPEIVDVFDGSIQFQLRQRPAIAGELFARLLEMVLLLMQMPKV